MLSQPDHILDMFQAVSDNISESTKMPPDLSFLCRDGKMVHSHKSLAIIFSPILRSVLSSIMSSMSSSAVVSIPDVSSSNLEQALHMLSNRWDNDDVKISEDLGNVFEILGIDIENYSVNENVVQTVSNTITNETKDSEKRGKPFQRHIY